MSFRRNKAGEASLSEGVRPSDSPHHPFGAVPPLSCRGWHVPQRENLSGCAHPFVVDFLREPGAKGELADVTGRLEGESIDLDYPGRQFGDSKLRLLAISSLSGLFCSSVSDTPSTTPTSIVPDDLILIVGRDGRVLHEGYVTSDGRLAHMSWTLPSLKTVSARSLAAYCARWRSAAGVKVLRKPWLPFRYTKRECIIPMRDGARLYTAIYEPCESTLKPIVLVRSPYPIGTYGYGGPGDLSDKIRGFTSRGYIIVEQNVRGTYVSEGEFEDCRILGGPVDEATDAYDTIDWLLANTRNNGRVGIYGVSYPGFYATCAAVCGHPALKLVSPQAPVTDWWMGDDAHHNGALMLCDMYGFGASFFRPKGNPTPDSPESLSEIPEDADLYTWFRGKPVSELLGKFSLKGFSDIVVHPDYDEFWRERNPLKHIKNVRPAVLVVGGWYDAEDAWGAEHTLKAIREQSPETESYAIFGPWPHGGWRKDSDFVVKLELPIFEYYLEGKGKKPDWRNLMLPTGILEEAVSAAAAGSQPSAELRSLRFDIAPGCYISDPGNPVPYMDIQSPWRDKAYMWADQRFAAARKDVLTQTLEGPLEEDFLATGPIRVNLVFSVKPAKSSRTKGQSDALLDLDLVVKLLDIAPDGAMSLVRGDVCPARWRNGSSGSQALKSGEAATLSFDISAICHRFAKGHSIGLQIHSSWFPLVAMNPQTFLPNPYTATAKDYRPVKVQILSGAVTVG